MVTTQIWLLVSMAIFSRESSSHWQSPRMPAKSLTSRGGLGRGGTCAIAVRAVRHNSKTAVKCASVLFHVAIVIGVVVGFVIIFKIVEGDLVTQLVFIVTLARKIL